MEGVAQLEMKKIQLIAALTSVADQMRSCAQIADDFSQVLRDTPVSPNGAAAFQPHFNAGAPFMQTPAPVKGSKRKAQALDDEDGKRKPKKLKDPNAPKRPPSSYLIFQNEIRRVISEQNPNMPNSELLKEISRRWKELPPEEKEVYERRTKVQKEKYNVAKAAYDLTNAQTVKTSPTPARVEPPAQVAKPTVTATPTTEDEDDDESSEEVDGSSDKSSEKSSTSQESSEEETPAAPPSKKTKKAVVGKQTPAPLPAQTPKKIKKIKT